MLKEKAIKLEIGFNENLKATGVNGKVVRYKSMLCLFFGKFDEINSYDDIKNANTEIYSEYFSFMLDRGIVLPPAQFEAIFISDAQTDEILDYTIEQNRLALEHIAKNA